MMLKFTVAQQIVYVIALTAAFDCGSADCHRKADAYLMVNREPPQIRMKSRSVPTYDVASRQQMKLAQLGLDIVFVVDTTASMTRLLNMVKDVARQSVKKVAAMSKTHASFKGRVRFGLVVYQDNTPGLTPAKLICPLTAGHDDFLRKIAPVKVANIGSAETKEDVLAGLKMAIEKSGWGKTSSRHIILVGDASAHVEGPKNTTGLTINQVIDLARQSSGGGTETHLRLQAINLHAVQGMQPFDPLDQRKCTSQFTTLAKNGGEFQGYYKKVDARNAKMVEDVGDELTTMIHHALKTLAEIGRGRSPVQR